VTIDRFCDVAALDDLKALSQFAGVRQRDLVALSGEDPFEIGTEADRKKAEWVVGLADRLGVDVREKHGRGFHYVLLSHGAAKPDGTPYTGTDADEQLLIKSIGYAIALDLLPFDAFPDRKSTVYVDAEHERDYVEPVAVVTAPDLHVPTLWRLSDPWATRWTVAFARPSELAVQPVLIDVTVEKAGVVPQLAPVARRDGCRLIVTDGFSGRALAAAIVRRTITDGRPRIVLPLTDADSAGESMPNATARHLEFLTMLARKQGEQVPPIYLRPVALTLEQVAEIEKEIGRPIPRAPDVGREAGRVELDALPEFAPGWLERQLADALDALLAEIDYSPLDEAEQSVRTELSDEFAPVREQMDDVVARAEPVVACARALLETPEAEAIAEQLDALRYETEELNREATLIAERFEPELPGPEVSSPNLDAVDWLLDPRRDYIDQLNAYRRFESEHRRRPPLPELVERRCLRCGGPMGHRKKIAKFCSTECKNEHLRLDRLAERRSRGGGP